MHLPAVNVLTPHAVPCAQVTMAGRVKTAGKIRMKIAQSLSDLIYYSQSVPFQSFDVAQQSPYTHMSSWKEAQVCDDPVRYPLPWCRRALVALFRHASVGFVLCRVVL